MLCRAAADPASPATQHYASALAIDPATGALRPHGDPAALPSRPIHASVDASGRYLLTAYNTPSSVTVHRLNADGTIGAPVAQPGNLDTGIYAHQIRVAPDNRTVMLVTRGNNAGDGQARGSRRDQDIPFQRRRADQSRLHRARQRARLRTAASRFSSDQAMGLRLGRAAEQALRLRSRWRDRPFARAAVHQRDAVRSQDDRCRKAPDRSTFIPTANSSISPTAPFRLRVPARGRSRPAARTASPCFAIDQTTGEPTLMQNLDGRGLQLRTFGIDPSGRLSGRRQHHVRRRMARCRPASR